MRHVETGAEELGHSMNGPQAGVSKGNPGQQGSLRHAVTRLTVGAVPDHDFEVVGHELHRFQADRVGKTVSLVGNVRLNGVDQSIDAGSGGYLRRTGISQFGINQG